MSQQQSRFGRREVCRFLAIKQDLCSKLLTEVKRMSKMGREFLRQQEQKFLYGRQGMKVLRIYDHLGELKKELNLYVEGEDFKWQSSYPEPVWLGTITLEDAGTEPDAVPVLEQALSLVEPEVKEEEVKDVPKNHDGKRSRVKRSTPSASSGVAKVIHQDDSGGDTPKRD